MSALGSAEEIRFRGNQKYKEGAIEEAISCYSEVLELEIDNTLAYANRSACYLSKGDYANAESDARMALDLDPSVEKFYFRLAKAKIGLYNLDGACEVIQQGLDIHPSSASLKLLLSTCKKDEKANKRSRKSKKMTWESMSTELTYCEPCEPDSGENGDKADEGLSKGAIIIETATGSSYSDMEYMMLVELKGLVKRIQNGSFGTAGMNNHFLRGKFKQLCEKEYFIEILFPGTPKEVKATLPQDLRELLLWKELVIDLTKISKSASSVLQSVKQKGETNGDVLDKDTEKMLCPQIVQEALARELESAVHKVGKDISKVLTKVQMKLASPTAQQTNLDQLDEEIPLELNSQKKYSVQEEYLGDKWAGLILADLVRFVSYEHMSNIESQSSSSQDSVDIPVRMTWLENSYDSYPALTEAIKKLQSLPYELNNKLDSAMKLLEPASRAALFHYRSLTSQPKRLDNRVEKGDSGISVTCTYHLVPPPVVEEIDDSGRAYSAGQVLLSQKGNPEGENDEVEIEDDMLVLHQSRHVLNSRSAAKSEYYVLAFYIHSEEEVE